MFSARPACPNGDVLTFGCENLQDQAELVENLKGAIQLRDDADQQRRDAESRLRHNQKIEALGHLAGGVAHDFNNTLTVVTGRAELLRAKNLTPSEGERHRVVDGAHPENTLYLPRSSSELLYCQEMPSFTSIPQSSRKRCSTSPSTHATACPRGGLGGAPTPRRSEF